MTASELIAILQTMPPPAVVVLGEHSRDTVVSMRTHDIALIAMCEVPNEYRDTYEPVARDEEHDKEGVILG